MARRVSNGYGYVRGDNARQSGQDWRLDFKTVGPYRLYSNGRVFEKQGIVWNEIFGDAAEAARQSGQSDE